MHEVLSYENSLPEAYHRALLQLYAIGDEADCADWDQKQKELSMTMVVENPLTEPMISKLFIGGPRELEQYRQEMLDGILDFEVERGNWKYTYHDRMVNYPLKSCDEEYKNSNFLNQVGFSYYLDQVAFVIEELKRNPSSRRAVIIIRDPSVDAFNDDPACLQHIQYIIRDDKLHCKVLFRSNDACKATFMNAFALIMLQKRIADELGVEIGSYTHRANSFHCYEKDYDMLEGYCHRIMQEELDDLTYDYIDEWEEVMEEYKPEIINMVKTLLNQ